MCLFILLHFEQCTQRLAHSCLETTHSPSVLAVFFFVFLKSIMRASIQTRVGRKQLIPELHLIWCDLHADEDCFKETCLCVYLKLGVYVNVFFVSVSGCSSLTLGVH